MRYKFTVLAIALAILIPAAAQAGPGTLSYMPPSTEAVVHVNVGKFKRSVLYRPIERALTSQGDVGQLMVKLRRVGFVPQRDIREVAVFITSSTLAGRGEAFLIVARGRFNEKSLVALMKKEGAKLKTTTAAGKPLYVIDNEGALAFHGDYALLGTVAEVKAGLNNNRRGGRPSRALRKYMRGGADAFFAMAVPLKLRSQLGRDVGPAGQIQALTARVGFSSGLAIEATAHTTSARSATQLNEVANMWLSEIHKAPEVKAMGLDKVLAKTTINAAGSKLKIRIRLPKPVVRQMLKQTLQTLGGKL